MKKIARSTVFSGLDRKFGVALAVAVTMILSLSTAFAQLPAVTSGTCNVTKMSYVTSRDSAETSISSTFVDLPDMVLFFDVAEGQCVKIEFSTLFGPETVGNIEIRAQFDQIPEASTVTVPDQVQITAAPVGYHIFTFIVPIESGLGPGNHNVRIQIRGSDTGSVVATKKRSLTVLHN